MSDETYTVKIDRRAGIVEITGPDKDWIAEQLERLEPVYIGEVADEIRDTDEPGDRTPAADNPRETSQRKRGKGSAFRGTRNDELAAMLTPPEVQEKLVAYKREREAHFKQAPDQAAIVAKFLKDNCGTQTVVPNDLYTVYDLLGWPSPNPVNALDNAKRRKGYFRSENGGYVLTHTGEQFALHGSKATENTSGD